MHRALMLTSWIMLAAGCQTLQSQKAAPLSHAVPSRTQAGVQPAPRESSSESPSAAVPPAPPAASKPSSEPLVTAAIFHFEEGNYARAEQLLRTSLASGLPSGADRAQAHKYLAFIYCVTERLPQCRAEFSLALKADRTFALSSAEAGHPTWGPAFRAVQGNR